MGANTSIFGRHCSDEVVAPASTCPSLAGLTERERQVFALVAKGLTNVQVAAELYVGTETVKTHVRSILIKLGLRNRVQLAVCAVRLHTDVAEGSSLGDRGSVGAERPLNPCRSVRGLGRLNERENEVAARLAAGATNAEIAQELALGVETIKSHVKGVLRKLGAANRSQVAMQVAWASARRDAQSASSSVEASR